ncbi:hypothetical protein BDZ91DRAFT_750469 [Kalaharituber pfeilii]|nr:hypothetical protein BDZ91DRAFT_750469 [Kalaharituber pfeilii]
MCNPLEIPRTPSPMPKTVMVEAVGVRMDKEPGTAKWCARSGVKRILVLRQW